MSAFIWLTIITALRILGRNRLRAGLTMLGIVIGVGAVIAMVSIGEGAKRAVQAQIATMGTNVIIIWPGATTVSGVRSGQGGVVTLTVFDALDLKKKIPLLSDTAWAKREVMQIVNGNRNWNGSINGISPSYLTIRDWSFSSGGPFTQSDMDSAARVALIGQTLVDNLFDSGEEPVGAVIRIKNVPFRVIGVLAPKGQSAQGSDQDDVIFIPLTTAQAHLFTDKALSGDIIDEQNIHALDAGVWMLNGQPLRASGTGGRKARTDIGDCWDHFVVTYWFPNDVKMDFSSTQCIKGYNDICARIYGSEGTAEMRYYASAGITGSKPFAGPEKADVGRGGARRDAGLGRRRGAAAGTEEGVFGQRRLTRRAGASCSGHSRSSV